jgi:hypothetical protein
MLIMKEIEKLFQKVFIRKVAFSIGRRCQAAVRN